MSNVCTVSSSFWSELETVLPYLNPTELAELEALLTPTQQEVLHSIPFKVRLQLLEVMERRADHEQLSPSTPQAVAQLDLPADLKARVEAAFAQGGWQCREGDDFSHPGSVPLPRTETTDLVTVAAPPVERVEPAPAPPAAPLRKPAAGDLPSPRPTRQPAQLYGVPERLWRKLS